jgi:predicted metal-dependent peptidase
MVLNFIEMKFVNHARLVPTRNLVEIKIYLKRTLGALKVDQTPTNLRKNLREIE